MLEAIKFIFLFLVGSTVLNLLIAIVARIKTGKPEFNRLIYYWIAVLLTYVSATILSNGPAEIGHAFFFQFISTSVFTSFLRDSLKLRTNWKAFFAIHLAAMLVSSYLLLKTSTGFTLSMLPVCFSTSLPFWRPVWHALVISRKKVNWIEKCLALVMFTGIIHIYDYAFFRLDPANAWWGWGISFAQYQCISVLLPLLLHHRREQSQRDTEDLNERLRAANSLLEEEQEVNELLIKTVSHDLANPLTVINSYMKMLQEEKIPAEERGAVFERMKMNVVSALDMISRIRSAIVTRNKASLVTLGPVNIKVALANALDLFRPAAEEKQVQLAWEDDGTTGPVVLAEEKALVEHVFSNVLSNAIKFSSKGSLIQVRVLEEERQVKVSFTDTGIGIRPERFNRRFLGPTEGTAGEKGSGYGLLIMGYFLRKFGGSYQLHSSIGPDKRGTTATLTFLKHLF